MTATAPPARSDGHFFGYPDEALGSSRNISDLCRFLGVSECKARALMRSEGAQTGSDRSDRWNPYQVVASLHGCPEAGGPPAPAATGARR